MILYKLGSVPDESLDSPVKFLCLLICFCYLFGFSQQVDQAFLLLIGQRIVGRVEV